MGDRDHSELTCPMAKAGFTMAMGTITMAIRPMGPGIRHGAHGYFSLGYPALDYLIVLVVTRRRFLLLGATC